jgi:hypothetical protein
MLYYQSGSYHLREPCSRFVFLHSTWNQNDHHLNKNKSPLDSIVFYLYPVCFAALFSDMFPKIEIEIAVVHWYDGSQKIYEQ